MADLLLPVGEGERLDYERRILAAECSTQRVLNELLGYLAWAEQQARYNHDALDPKAAEILTNIAAKVRAIDVASTPTALPGAEDVALRARIQLYNHFFYGNDEQWTRAVAAMVAFANSIPRASDEVPANPVGEGLALEVGERFLNACFSAWAAGEPAHRVRTMCELAGEFRDALNALKSADAASSQEQGASGEVAK